MKPLEAIHLGADLAAVLTAIVAIWAWVSFRLQRRRKRILLEKHLYAQREHHGGKRTIEHLKATVGLSEDEIFAASLSSRHIRRYGQIDKDTNQTVKVLFGWVAKKEGD